MIPDKYLEKVYSGFLGMNIGIRLGAPVEPTIWTYERILNTYGEITDYVKDYKNFAADDDVNGPVYFLRALYDDAKDGNLKTPGCCQGMAELYPRGCWHVLVGRLWHQYGAYCILKLKEWYSCTAIRVYESKWPITCRTDRRPDIY